MKKNWKIRPVDAQHIQQFALEAGISPILSKLLLFRGISQSADCERYFVPSPGHLHDPFLFSEMETAVNRILKAVQNQEKVIIHGDYDVDGITSVCILLETLLDLGLSASYFIPARLSDGYGLQAAKIPEFAEEYSLLITVDCGTTAYEAIELANQLGMDVIVTDHHDPGPERPAALAVINPQRQEDTYPFKNLCGAGVAWKLAQALRMRGGRMRDELEQIELAALGTVADVMPLQGENRTITALALKRFSASTRPGLIALMDLAKVIPSQVDVEALSFRIAPRLNAAGRMGNADAALHLLYTQEPEEGLDLARELNQLNQQRQTIERQVFDEASRMVEEKKLHQRSEHVLFVAGPKWHIGVLGIVASRLLQRYNKSVFILSQEDNTAHGSARGMDGADLIPWLDAARPYAISCGGHSSAAGMRVEEKNLPAFEQALYEAARNSAPVAEQVLWLDSAISLEQIDSNLMNDLAKLEPYGEGNEEPVFYSKAQVSGYGARVVGNGHLRLSLEHPRGMIDAIGFNLGHKMETLQGNQVELAFKCRYNEFQGRKTIDLHLIDVRSYIPQNPTQQVSAPKPAALTLDRKKLGDIYRLLKNSANENNQLDYNNVFVFAQLIKVTKKEFETALKVFSELEFLRIKDGKIVMTEAQTKRDLSESPTYRSLLSGTS